MRNLASLKQYNAKKYSASCSTVANASGAASSSGAPANRASGVSTEQQDHNPIVGWLDDPDAPSMEEDD